MAAIDDLNAAIQAEDVEITTLQASIVKIDTDVDTLLGQIAAGSVTPAQIATALTAIQSHTSSLTTAVGQLTAEDAKANPPS